MTPSRAVRGKVVSVNAKLQFVVLDFSFRALPAVGQRLSLYRQGAKVGEVRVSGPLQEPKAVADIIAGGAQLGDEARED
jgi:hypothetical protein